jgi:hypothetical protein
MNSAAKMNGGPFAEQETGIAHKWREMFQRRRRMRNPLLVFNMSIFNFDEDGIAFSANSKFTKTARDKGPHRRSMKWQASAMQSMPLI